MKVFLFFKANRVGEKLLQKVVQAVKYRMVGRCLFQVVIDAEEFRPQPAYAGQLFADAWEVIAPASEKSMSSDSQSSATADTISGIPARFQQ